MLTVNCRRADNVSLDNISVLGSSIDDKLVHIAMEGLIGQVGELVNGHPVVVLLLRPFTKSVIFAVFPSQDASTSRVQPESRALLGVAAANAFRDGLCGTLVVRGIGGV